MDPVQPPQQLRQIILVDDDEQLRIAGEQCLMLADFDVTTCASAEQALQILDADFAGVVIADVRMPGMDGLALMAAIHQLDCQLPVILLTGHGDVDMAVQAMHDGAWDFQQKPFHPDALVRTAERALLQRQLVLENRQLRQCHDAEDPLATLLIGNSPQMQALRQSIRELADLPVNVVIHGETGSGKEQVALALHQLSQRRSANLVALNCAALPEQLFESEVFGVASGAYTGATSARAGKLEHAQGGTLLLDEIETMPLSLQVKLLRVLQERQVERLGSNRTIALDIRVISATKEDLLSASQQGRFRQDLYYRLAVAELHIPPLRERRQDIPLLFDAFVQQLASHYQRPAAPITSDDLVSLLNWHWPGNVRELHNIAERFVLGRGGQPVSVASLLNQPAPEADSSFQAQVQSFEKALLDQTLRKHHGQVQPILDELSLPRRTFNEVLKKHGLVRKNYLSPAETVTD